MEIYSPISKNKDLFKKNRLKVEQAKDDSYERNEESSQTYKKVVNHSQESILSKAGKVLAERLKSIFEFEEAE
jgi:hypothetical protein